MRSARFLSGGVLVLVLAAGALLAGDNWPQFRGPTADGHSDSKGLPVKWSETENVRWKTEIPGKAWSSPVVWNGKIWLTNAFPDGKQLYVVCVDFATGKVLQNIKVFDIENPQYCIEKNSYASPTPVIEEGRLYAHFGAHGTACVDTVTGKTLWTRQDLECNHHRAPASSPIVYQNLLYLTFDGFDVQYVVALDKNTGKTVWKKDRNITYGSDNGDIKKAYATPAIIRVNGKDQLVNPSAQTSMAYDPLTGEELWRVDCGGMNVSCLPLFGHGMVYMTTAAGGFQLYAVKPDGTGNVTNSHVVWKLTKGVPKQASQLLVGDLLYMGNEQGVLTCIEAKTGDVVWQQRVDGKAVFTASPIYADGKLYFFGEEGVAAVVAEGREFKLLATNTLDGGFMASPAVSGKSLILRTKTALYRVESGVQ